MGAYPHTKQNKKKKQLKGTLIKPHKSSPKHTEFKTEKRIGITKIPLDKNKASKPGEKTILDFFSARSDDSFDSVSSLKRERGIDGRKISSE